MVKCGPSNHDMSWWPKTELSRKKPSGGTESATKSNMICTVNLGHCDTVGPEKIENEICSIKLSLCTPLVDREVA